MNVLIFEWKNFGIEDICDAFKDMAIKYKCILKEMLYMNIAVFQR